MQKNRKIKHIQKEKVCFFCANNYKDIDYKETSLLRKFINSYFKIVPRRRSGTCHKHQRKLSNAIKNARIMILIPFIRK